MPQLLPTDFEPTHCFCMNFEKLVFVDLETTGANPAVDRITEIGLIEVDALGNARHWSSLINPQVTIPAFIQGLTGITNSMVEHAPVFTELAAQLHERLQGAIFVAHNARFDYGFLRNAFTEAGYALRCEVLCTVKLSRALFPDERKHNLDALISRHGLVANGRHRALADADLIWQFWQQLKTQIPAETFHATLGSLLQRPNLPSNLAPDALEGLPDTPGVYLFYGENDLPLYVGKSVHLRQRVLSHFNSDHKLYKDMRLSQQIQRIEWRETCGEIGALLLEAKLIKTLQPIHNRMLRRQRGLCAWRLQPGQPPTLTFASEEDFGHAEGLYGLFSSRRKAEATLRELADANQLCLIMLGLEKRCEAGKPCFAAQLHRCKGACTGKESDALHHARLEAALKRQQIKTWPYAGPIGLVEGKSEENREVHVINNWCYLGTAKSEEEVHTLADWAAANPAFDMDTYKILSKALQQARLPVRKLYPI